MPTFELLAMAYRYPFPGHLQALRRGLDGLGQGSVRRNLERFLDVVGQMAPVEWEELHTRTVDLGPLFAPYVGWVMWGENYKRGKFMSSLKREQEAAGVDCAGELPDHLDPVLRYLAATTEPLNDLTEVLQPALERMSDTLKAAEPTNPYLHLLEATRDAIADPVAGGDA